MKKPTATQVYGALVVAASALWIWQIGVMPLVRWFGARASEVEAPAAGFFASIRLLVVFGHLGILTVIGVFLYCGIGLLKNPPLPTWYEAEAFPEEERRRGQIVIDPVVTYVRFSMVLFAAVPALWLLSIPAEQPFPAVPEPIRDSLGFLLFAIITLLVYIIALRLLLRSRGYRDVALRYVIGKPVVALVALILCWTLFDLVEWLWPQGHPAANTGGGRFELLSDVTYLLGPLLAAYLFYRITVRLLRYREMELDLRRMGLRTGEGKPKP